MSLDLGKYIQEVLSRPLTRTFIERAEAIHPAPDAPFKSWIGINFSPDTLISLKIYYTWYQDLHPSPVRRLLEAAPELDFFDRYPQRHTTAVLDSVEYGSGFTIALKADRSGPTAYGYVYRVAHDQQSELADDPLLLEFGSLPHVLPGMGHYPLQHGDELCRKHYHYIQDPAFSDFIQEKHLPFSLPQAPVIEYGVGPFPNAEKTPPQDCHRKVILLGNYHEIASAFLAHSQDWPMVQSIQALADSHGISALAPGKYIDRDVWSLYLFATEDMAVGTHMNTLRRFLTTD